MKCEVCGKGIAKTFLDKVNGTYIRDAKGKQRLVCFECQSQLKDKTAILDKIQK